MSTGTGTARSVARRVAEPVRAPVRHVVTHYATFFEDLIHAVKSELVGKIDDLDELTGVRHRALVDQLGVQAATIRSLTAEVERLRATVEKSGSNVGRSRTKLPESAARTTA